MSCYTLGNAAVAAIMAAENADDKAAIVDSLLIYDIDGTEPPASAISPMLWAVIKDEADRIKLDRNGFSTRKSEAGKANAAKRWNNRPMPNDAKKCKTMPKNANDAKMPNDALKERKEKEIKEKEIYSVGSDGACARDEAPGANEAEAGLGDGTSGTSGTSDSSGKNTFQFCPNPNRRDAGIRYGDELDYEVINDDRIDPVRIAMKISRTSEKRDRKAFGALLKSIGQSRFRMILEDFAGSEKAGENAGLNNRVAALISKMRSAESGTGTRR